MTYTYSSIQFFAGMWQYCHDVDVSKMGIAFWDTVGHRHVRFSNMRTSR